MIRKLMSMDALAMWASIGLMVLLCGPWVLPSNKLYHQLIIFLLWLPALLALSHQSFRQKLKQPELLIFGIFALWTLFVMVVEGGDELIGRAKVVFYVAMTLLGGLLAAHNRKWRFESMLLSASIIGGFLAAVSWVVFYAGAEQPLGSRLVALGLWDTIIMAAHAVGALAILGLFTQQIRRWNRQTIFLLLIPVLGYGLFLGFSQTRGVWIALLVCLLAMIIARPTKAGIGLIVLVAVCLAAVAVFDAELLLQRGVSYRPVLWAGGVNLIEHNWATGVGFNEYFINVPELGLFKHPHNLYLDTGVRLGVPGLLIFLSLWLTVGWRGWLSRTLPLGQALLALWIFATVSLMTDGIGLWLKPNADWLITWLPVCLSIVLACAKTDRIAGGDGQHALQLAAADKRI